MNSGSSETNVGQVEAVFIDGAAAAHMLEPGTVETFQAYADNVFVPYIVSQLKYTKRIDIVWDVYQTNSLQVMTRQRRGKGFQRKVEPCTLIPKNLKDFLSVEETKAELFHFLSLQVVNIPLNPDKEVFATKENTVLCCPTL